MVGSQRIPSFERAQRRARHAPSFHGDALDPPGPHQYEAHLHGHLGVAALVAGDFVIEIHGLPTRSAILFAGRIFHVGPDQSVEIFDQHPVTAPQFLNVRHLRATTGGHLEARRGCQRVFGLAVARNGI